MKCNKNFHKVAYGLISLVVMILIGVIIHQQRLLNSGGRIAGPVSSEPAESKMDTDTSAGRHMETGSIKTPPPVAMKEFDELEYQLNAAEEELAMTQDQLSAEIDKQNDLKELQKMMSQTPLAKNQLRVAMRNNLDKLYGPMMTELGFSEEQAEAFKDLIVNYQMAKQEFFEKMQGKTLTQEDQIEVAQNIAAIDNDYQDKMDELFGAAATSRYLAYREKEGELQFTSEFSEYLSGADKLTDDQREKLIDSMADARKELFASQIIENGKPINSADVSEEERIKNINIEIMEGYLNSAKTVLSPSQLEQFEFYTNKRIQQINSLSNL